MTNLEGPRAAAARGACRRRTACAPTSRSSPRWPTRLGAPGPLGRRAGGRLRRAAPRQRGRAGRLRRHQLRAHRRARTACSGPARPATTPARRGCSSTASPTPDGRARFVAGRAPRRGRGHRRRVSAVPDHRPGAAALPVRHADPAGRRAARRAPSRSSSASRSRRRARLVEDGDRVRVDQPARRGARTVRGHRHDPGRHGVHAVPLGRRRVGQPADQPRARPDLAACRSSRCARSRRAPDVAAERSADMTAKRRLVVIGNGMAGCRFVQELLERDVAAARDHRDRRRARRRLQPHPAVQRARRRGPRARHRARRAGWYARQRVDAASPASPRSRIDRERKQVAAGRRQPLGYDVLVLATGSAPWCRRRPGCAAGRALLPGAVAFRTPRTAPDRPAAARCRLGVGARRRRARPRSGPRAGRSRAAGHAGAARAAADGAPARRRRRPRARPHGCVPSASTWFRRRRSRRSWATDRVARHHAGRRRARGEADLLVLCCGVRPRVDSPSLRAGGLAAPSWSTTSCAASATGRSSRSASAPSTAANVRPRRAGLGAGAGRGRASSPTRTPRPATTGRPCDPAQGRGHRARRDGRVVGPDDPLAGHGCRWPTLPMLPMLRTISQPRRT